MPFATDKEASDFASVHLLYEVEMLAFTAAEFPRTLDGSLKNALIESFAVHLRNLIDFFYLQSPRADDVTWRDFMGPAASWSPPDCSSGLTEARTMANKQISHITLLRYVGDDPRKFWHATSAREISDVLKAFSKAASPNRLPARLFPS